MKGGTGGHNGALQSIAEADRYKHKQWDCRLVCRVRLRTPEGRMRGSAFRYGIVSDADAVQCPEHTLLFEAKSERMNQRNNGRS